MPDHNLVVVIDDDPVVVRLIEKMLARTKARVLTTSSASGALSLLSEHQSEVGLVLLDLAMPTLSGYELCRQLRAQPHLAHLPVVAVTADVTNDVNEKAAEVGINEIVIKPFKQEALLDVIRRYGIPI